MPPPVRDGVQLKLAVVDDPAMAAAIRRHRGEWAARSGGNLHVSEMTSAEFATLAFTGTDILIYPSQRLGTLARRGAVIPVRSNVLNSESFDQSDIFPLVRRHVTAWDQREMAVPFGSPVLCLLYRADLFDRLGLAPPSTWEQYDLLIGRLRNRSDLIGAATSAEEPWYATVEPLAAPWAANVFLARAACYAKSPSRYSTLFDIDTMQPLIAGPPFVRALTEMRAALGESDLPAVDPAGARQAIWRGQAAMALAWPAAAGADAALPSGKPEGDKGESQGQTAISIGVAALPGARDLYSPASQAWETRDAGDDGRVPVIGFAGRIGSVTATTRNAPTAFQLLVWLCGSEMGARIGAASPATTLFRHSQVAAPKPWVDPGTPTPVARDYAHLIAQTLSRRTWLEAPRIPEADRYMVALDQAVRNALAGRQSPSDALQDAARSWQEITHQVGLEVQKEAYAQSLGLQ